MKHPVPIIGILSPFLGGFYFGGLLRGIHEQARALGAQVVVIQTIGETFNFSIEAFNLPLAYDYVDGWIIILESASPEFLQRIQRDGKGLVSLSTVSKIVSCPAVLPDNQGGVFAAVEHLLEHGHQRIAFVGNMQQEDIRQRHAGYQAALAARGIAPDAALFVDVPDNMLNGGQLAARILIERQLPCTAVVAATDFNAIGLMEAFKERGYRIPADVAIVGFDDIEDGQYTMPPLSSVRQRFDALGAEAARLLLDQLAGQDVPPVPHYVPTTFIARGSCNCRAVKTMERLIAAETHIEDWQALAQQRLVMLALAPQQPDPATPPQTIWPGVSRVVQALDAALNGQEAPSINEQTSAWQEAIALHADLDALSAMATLLERTGQEQAQLLESPALALGRLTTFLTHVRTDLMRAWQASEREQRSALYGANSVNYRINMALLGDETAVATARHLHWLRHTPMRRGCLGLLKQSADGQQLDLAGCYALDSVALPELGTPLALQQFPPETLFDHGPDHSDLVMLLPIRTAKNPFLGVLALLGPSEVGFGQGLNSMGQWATELGAVLEREDLETSLAQAQQAAEEANRLKTQFLANMSHELRTPLNSIINFAKLIGRDNFGLLSEIQRDFQRRIVDNGEHLLGLINDILDLAKIEAGHMDLFYEEIQLQPLLQGVLSTAIGLTRDKGLEVTLEGQEDLPPVMVDKTRVRQVLLNLLSNAAKFTREGEIVVRAERRERMVEIVVRDTGIGIAPEHHAMIFDEFRQVQGELTREYQGTGLGLPICKRLVEMHGGTMWLESAVGVGSSFYFTLPIAHAYLPEEELPPPEQVRSGGGPLIVVVDDDQNAQQILRRYLESNGYQVHGVLDSRRAIEIIRQIRPELVILDVMMPYHDGWELLSLLKSEPETRAIPVIMCSIVEQERLGVALGADAYLVKPVREEEIISLVSRWAKKEGTVLVVDDDENARHVLRSMLQNSGYDLRQAAGGAEALELLSQRMPDLMILDLMMPGIDGFEVLRRLRAMPEGKTLPVIVLTAHDLDGQEHEWLRAQSQAFLQKAEVSTEEFLSYVRQLIATVPS